MSKKQRKPQPPDISLVAMQASREIDAFERGVQRQLAHQIQREQVIHAAYAMDTTEKLLLQTIRLAKGQDLINELRGVDAQLTAQYTDLRRTADALNYNIDALHPEMGQHTFNLVTVIGKILNEHITPAEGAREIQALVKIYNPDMPNLLAKIGRRKGLSEWRIYLGKAIGEYKFLYTNDKLGYAEIGARIIADLKAIPASERTDAQKTALAELTVQSGHSAAKFAEYLRGVYQDYKEWKSVS